MGGGGGGGGWNPFENVSWNTPFGDSQVGKTLYGGTSGGVNSVFNNVSWDKPLGDNSALGQALYGNSQAPLTSEGKDKETGEQVIIPGTGGSSTTNDPQFGGTILPPKTPTASAPSNVLRAYNPGALPKYLPNDAERKFREDYMKSLKPNVNFNIMGESSPYKNATTAPKTGV